VTSRQAPAAQKHRLRVTQYIRAKPEKVFEAWTTPALMKRWFCPENLKPGVVEADVRPGGKFKGSMVGPDETFTATGIYKEIIPGRKLVFTHGWESAEEAPTLVTVEFLPKDGGTEIILTQEGFADADETEGHREGWISTLEHLQKVFL
jgi:uncharacterized protein YndB with AHSA1/START domain